ncbi:MAG: ATP-binding cassette domain-containing protein, partial [Deltaproteobacteria bacterium]|nr:ATP-binding cassette domain-containing protein [Deltaproteobacteria bacterium]
MLLKLDHVSKHFGAVIAVNDVSFTLSEGEVLGIMGPNGSGKTTLLNLIMGVYPLNQGTIQFDGRRVSGLSTNDISGHGIGRTYQIPQPFQRMTVLENLLVGERYGGSHQSAHAARENAMAILERTGLGKRSETEAGKLGLLDLKRLELARALSLRPRLLLLDEIAAGLIQSEVVLLRDLLRDLKKEGHTVLLIEHVLNFIFDLSDRIMVLNFGERIAMGSPKEIADDPQVHDVYLGTKKDDEAAAPEVPDEPVETGLLELLSLQDVNAGYGSFQALFDISLDIREGEISALIGVNGAGKTTLIRVINRQLPIISGEILFKGESIV